MTQDDRCQPQGNKKSNNGSRAKYLKQRAMSNSLITGPGIFFTCPRGKEAAAVYEFKDLLERVAEEINPKMDEEVEEENKKSSDGESDTAMEDDIASQIKRELQELRGGPAGSKECESLSSKRTPSKKRFESKKMDCECLGFISFPKGHNPVEFSSHIVQQIQQGRPGYGLRFIQRITPVSMTCSATSPIEFEKIVSQVLTPHFGGKCRPAQNESDDQTVLAPPRVGLKFRIEPIIRCHDKPLNRAEVIRIAGDVVRKFNADEFIALPDDHSVGIDTSELKHRVSIEDAQIVILISVYRYVAGVSVVEGYDRDGKRFNLRVLAETQEKKMAQD